MSAALQNLVQYIKDGNVGGFTPDVPVGPPYIAKPGIIQLASRSASPLLQFAWDAHSSWEFNSWDRTILPLPLSRIVVLYSREPIYVPSGITDKEYEELRNKIDSILNTLSYQARYCVKNNIKGVDPRDIPAPINHMEYLPRKKELRNKCLREIGRGFPSRLFQIIQVEEQLPRQLHSSV